MITTISPISSSDNSSISPISSSDNTYAYYKQKIDDIGNKTVEIHVMISSLRNNTLFLRKENINLKSELQKVMQQRDDLNKKIVHLEADKQILEYEIGKLTTNLTKVQDSEKALQVKLDNTTDELNAANHSLNIMLDVLEKIQKRITIISDIPSASKYFMEKKANYTDYVNNYANDQNALNVFITNINNNMKKSKEKIDVLESKLNNKNIELNETRKALNITIVNIERIYDDLKITSNYSENIVEHNRTKRNINKQYNEAKDDYTYKQIMDNFYEVRIADSEQKVEEILPIPASFEKENNILKSPIYSNEGKEIDDLHNYNLTESNLKSFDTTTNVAEVQNNKTLNKAEDYTLSGKDGFVENKKDNYNKNQEDIIMPENKSTISYFDGIVEKAIRHRDTILKHLNEQHHILSGNDLAYKGHLPSGNNHSVNDAEPTITYCDDRFPYINNASNSMSTLYSTPTNISCNITTLHNNTLLCGNINNSYALYTLFYSMGVLTPILLYVAKPMWQWVMGLKKSLVTDTATSGTDQPSDQSLITINNNGVHYNVIPQSEDMDSFDSFSTGCNTGHDNFNSLPIAQPSGEKDGYLEPKKSVAFAQNTQIAAVHKPSYSNIQNSNTSHNSMEAHCYDVPFNVSSSTSYNSKLASYYLELQGSNAIMEEM